MIEIVCYPGASLAPRLERILGRRLGPSAAVEETVRPILSQVRREGDAALERLSEQIEKVPLTAPRFRVPAAALQAALAAVDPALMEAMVAAAANIRAFHARQLPAAWFVEDGDGVLLGKKVSPVRRVGVCAPAGEVPLFSSLMMAVIPAQVAGVEQICVVSPPRSDGLPQASRELVQRRLQGRRRHAEAARLQRHFVDLRRQL